MDHLSWQHNFVKLYMEYSNKVEEYYRFMLDLDQWAETRNPRPPPPGLEEEIKQSMRSITEGIKSCTKKALLQYLNCQTQVKDRPQSDMEQFFSQTDKLVNLFNNMSMIHEGALKVITCIGKHSLESFFQVPAPPDQKNSDTFHKVSAPPHLHSSGISHQVSAHLTPVAQGFANRSQHHYSQMIQKLTLRC